MSSLKQLEANRLNAQKSTGPRSVVGRAVSSQNALKTGIDAESLIIRGEKAEDLETLTAEYFTRFRPQTPEERHYVDSLVRDDWQLRRLAKADTQIWDHTMNAAFKLDENAPLGHAFAHADKTFTRLQRRIDATHRSYNTALRELRRLQSDQSRDREGAVPQPNENTPTYLPIGFGPAQLPEAPGPIGAATVRERSSPPVPLPAPEPVPSLDRSLFP